MTTCGSRQLRSRIAAVMVFAMVAVLLLGTAVSPSMAAPGSHPWTHLVPQGLLDLTAAIAQGPGGAVPEQEARYLVGFRQGVRAQEANLLQAVNAQVYRRFDLIPAVAARMSPQAAARLAASPGVAYVEPDLRVRTLSQQVPWGIERIGAPMVHGTGNTGEGVKVAIIDTGIDYTHPDLAANYMGGYDFVNDNDDPMDDHGHGTHCAGTVAAADNGQGVIGVAPDAWLYGLKMLSASGEGDLSDGIAAIEWCVNNGIDIASMSWGAANDPISEALKDACAAAFEAGVLLVAAAGNDGYGANTVNQPAILDSVIAVAATDQNDSWAWFSSTGPAVELAAPGVGVLSTWPGDAYATHDGTSMACPHVSGTAALIIASGVTDASEVRERLRLTAQDLGAPGWNEYFGYGLVRADWAAGGYDVVVTGVMPSLGSMGETVSVSISGLGFEPGAVPQLVRSGHSPITGSGVTVVSDTQITCQFNLSGAAEGSWDVVVINPDSSSGLLPEGFYVMGPVDEDFETGDFSRWPWNTYGAAEWFVSDAESHTGNYAARAGSVPFWQSSTLEITLDCQPGTISFFKKLSAPGGLLFFYVNGTAVGEWTGVSDWDSMPVRYEVGEGTHTFKWEYWELLGHSGTVWLDDISFPPLSGDHIVAITSGPGGTPNPVQPGAEVACSVGVYDSLGHHLNYLWSAEGDAGSFDDPTLASPTWIAPATAGEYEITVTVTCAEDEESSATGSYIQEVADVIVTGIAPDAGTNDGIVSVTISGIGFESGATTHLGKSGQSPIVGTGVTVVSDTQITCDFNLLGAAEGHWDVAVVNPDREPAVLREGFNVTRPVDEDFETGDFSRWPWVTYGDALWTVSDEDARTGDYAARAGTMLWGGSSFLEITLTTEAPGNISFYKKLSCPGGLLIFAVNGNEIAEWSGITGWDAVPYEYTVPAGTHTFRWEYWDPLGDPDGTVWLDDISFPPLTDEHTVTIIAGPSGTPNPVAPNGEVTCSVTATDSLGHDLNYLWSAEGDAGSFDDTSARNPTWTAPDTPGDYKIAVAVTCAEDSSVSASSYYTQQVQPLHEITITEPPSGDPNPVASEGEVLCSVAAEDNLGHELTYDWKATDGSFDDATAESPTWTAPSNTSDAAVEYTISVTVTCAEDASVSASDSYVQQVEPVAHEVTIIAGPEGDPNPVASGGSVACSVTAEDSRGHDLLYEWSATGGSFDSETSATATWTAPSNTSDATVDYTISVTVTCSEDGTVSATDSYVQQVEPVAHEVTIIAGPEGDPNPVASGGSVACSVTAEDSRGHDLLYAWSADAGSFDDATAESPTWTAPANTSDDTVEYTISVTVTCAEDSSISATDSYVQQVEPVAHEVTIVAGPEGDPNPVASGGTVACSVTAEDSRGHDLNYLWSADAGSFDDAASESPTWTAPANTSDAAVEYTITVTVTCAEDGTVSASDSYVQQVEPVAHEVTIVAGPEGDPNPVASGGTVACSVSADDSREHDLLYEWTATGGSFENHTSATPTWTAPANTTDAAVEYTITVTVTCAEDSSISATDSYVQQVEPVAHEVKITAGPEGDPNPVASGGTVACSVTAEASRGHDLNYLWSADAGSFDDATAESPTWTAPANTSDGTVEYTISVTVTCSEDGTVSATDSYVQQVEPVAHEVTIVAGPEGDPNPVAFGGTVACSVSAEDSRGHDLNYLWSADAGSFDDTTAESPTWTAPANTSDGRVEYTISVTVTCSEDGTVSATDSYVQQVEPVAHEVTITAGPEGDPNPVASGGSVACWVMAEDSRGHELLYEWTATGGSFENHTSATATWIAPANTTDAAVEYTITVTVTCAEDSSISATAYYQQQVEPVEPEVTITAGPEGDPNPVASGGSVACSVSAADSRGHDLLYAWTATGGSFDNETSETATWTAPANTSDDTVEYTISVTVTCAEDSSISATESYVQQVEPVAHEVTITAGPEGDPNPVSSGGTVACSVTAGDSRGHDLLYEWSASDGSFDDAASESPTWTAPANTSDDTVGYTISVTVTCAEDSSISATDSYVQQVEPVAHEVTITAGPEGDPNPVASGGTVTCSVTAEDSRGHDLNYLWSADAGSFDNETSATPTWTAPANTTDAAVEYTITVTVTCAEDSSISATDSYVQQVEPVAHEVTITAGPEGDPNPVASGGTVACSVTAEDSRGHELSYEWTATGGSFENHTSASPTWTAPANTSDATVEYTISVTVTCAEDSSISATDSYQQQVEPVPHEVTIVAGPEGDPNPVSSGGTVVCSVTAEDSRGHDLLYEWTATGGSFENHTSATATWTAPANTSDAAVEYTISVTVTCTEDSSVSATDSYVQQVEPVEHEVTITAGPEGDPNPVASGGTVACSVTAEDSPGHDLLYEWTATGGSFENHTSATPTWTAPANTTDAAVEYTITVTVTCSEDGTVSATDSYVQQVEPVAHEITIVAGPAGDPNPVASGGSVACSVMAEDSRGHDLLYEWTATGGSFENHTSATATWTAPANTGDAPVEYTITVTVTCAEDGTVSASDSYVQQVEPVAHEVTITAGPEGDPNPVASGGTVACWVTAEDSRGHDLLYAWSADAGSFDDATAESPTWTAPANTTDAAVEYTISVTVTCAEDSSISATASYQQQVEPVAHEVTITAGPEGDPNPVASGGLVACSVMAADSRGHDLLYEWTATGGSFDNETSETATWTAPANTTDAAVEYTITVTVTCAEDDSISATASYQQQVEPVAHEVTITAGPEGDPNPVASGGTVACSVSAEDSRGHDLLYAWSASDGSFDDATAESPTWTAPANTSDATVEYTISVTVTCAEDASVSALDSYVQQVEPVVHEVTITAGPEGDPNPVASGGTVACSVTAEDSRGHELLYAWSASGGSFNDAASESPTWTAPANTTDAAVEYTISVTVTCAEDGTVSATDSYVQQVEPVAHEVTIVAGPEGDPNPVASGGSVACSVTAEDSRGHDLLYAWSASDGSFDDASAQNPTWTAPSNTSDAAVEYTISVTVTCAEDSSISATASYQQQVEPVEHEVTITAGPEGDPNPVASGGSVACSVTAEHNRGHALSYEWSASGGRFDNTTAQNPTWRASTAPGDYLITVTVTCSEDQNLTATASFTQRVVPGRGHQFRRGMQMIALPLVPDNPDPAQLGFDDGKWARWDQTVEAYVYYDEDPTGYTRFDPAESVPGKGYWAQFGTDTEVSVPGLEPSDDALAIPLPAGWSQIGNPRPTELRWSILGEGALKVRHNGTEMSLAEARDKGLCEDYAWAYREGSNYELVCDHSVLPIGQHDRLNPWEGYWFYSSQPLELVFPSVMEAGSAAPRPAAQRAEGDWSIPLLAGIDSGSSVQVVVGQSATPRRMQLPPSFGTDVQLSIVEDGHRLGVDLQQHGEGPGWTLQAASGVADAKVTLQWPDLSEVPHEYRPMLVDTATGKRTYMRTSQGYSFTAGEAGEVRRFEVQVVPAEVGVLVATASASVAGGGNVELRVTLSAAATVNAEMMNIAGRQVGTVCRGREMEAGAETLLWDAMSDRGTRLPGGMYLIRITARTEDGQQASALAPLQLVR